MENNNQKEIKLTITFFDNKDDDDVYMHDGQIDGIFDEENLSCFLGRYGASGRSELIEHLDFLKKQVSNENNFKTT